MAAPKKLPPWLRKDPVAAAEDEMPVPPMKKGGKKQPAAPPAKPPVKGKGKPAPKRKPPAKGKK
jgi:hypothetical protein